MTRQGARRHAQDPLDRLFIGVHELADLLEGDPAVLAVEQRAGGRLSAVPVKTAVRIAAAWSGCEGFMTPSAVPWRMIRTMSGRVLGEGRLLVR